MDETARLHLENKKVRDRCKQLEDVEENYKQCKIQCESAKDQINILQCDKNTLQEQTKQLNEQLLVLENKCDYEAQEKSRLEAELQETEKKLMESNQQAINTSEALQEDLLERDLLIRTLKDENEALKIQSKNYTAQQAQSIDNLKQDFQNVKSKIAKLSQENEELNDCLNNADAEVQKQTKQNEDLKNKITEQNLKFEEDVQKLNKTVQEKDVRIQNLTQELSERSLGQDDAVKILLQNKTLREKDRENTTKLITILNENEELQTKNAEYEEQVKNLEVNLNAATNNIDELEAKMVECEKLIQELTDRLDNVQNNLAQTTIERDDLLNSKATLEEVVKDLTEQHAKAQQNLKDATAQLISTLQQKTELSKQLEGVNVLKKGPLEDIESNMKAMLINISRASEELFEDIQKTKQHISEQFLNVDFDETSNDKKK